MFLLHPLSSWRVHLCSLFIIDLSLKCFSISVNYYFQVSFNLKVNMYIMAKITWNTLTELSDYLDFGFANEISDTKYVLHLNVRYELKTIPLLFTRSDLGKGVLILKYLFLSEGSAIASTKVMLCFSKKWRGNTRFSSLWLHDKPTFPGDTILWLFAARNAQNFVH